MKYNYNGREVDTNLGGYSFEKLKSGKWKLGFISDNNGLDDESSDYYMDFSMNSGKETLSGRTFKNKLTLKLIDNTIHQHLYSVQSLPLIVQLSYLYQFLFL